MEKRIAINADIKAINKAAREARRICTDIIRQTSIKPYYGKRGAAAVYADEDESRAQTDAIADVLVHLTAANELLVNIAMNGGTTQAKVHEIIRSNHNFGKGQIIEIEDTPETSSTSEKITLQK